jgi:SAM-dependent methyltransferase
MTGNVLESTPYGRSPGPDLNAPSVARMSDHLLNGKDNFACDRLAVTELLRAAPELPSLARAGREFLMRTAALLAAEHRIGQFLDLGSGLPASPCTHEVVENGGPTPPRVVYIDSDPFVTVHNRALLAGGPGVCAFQDDLCFPDVVIARLSALGAVDFGRPVAVLLGDVLPYLPDPVRTVRAFRNVMAEGSALVLSHLSRDRADPGMVAAIEKIYRRNGARFTVRSDAQVAELFAGFTPVSEILDSRPDPTVPGLTCYAGYGLRTRGPR